MKNFAVVYLIDISKVPDFNAMYELYDPCTVMFFFRNKVSARGQPCPRLHRARQPRFSHAKKLPSRRTPRPEDSPFAT